MRGKLRFMIFAATVVGLLFGSRAEASPRVRIKIRVEPVENQKQLHQLMLENSMRIYRQRLRFFLMAEKQRKEQAKGTDPKEQKNQYRYRHRHRHQLAGEQSKEQAKGADPKKQQNQHRHRVENKTQAQKKTAVKNKVSGGSDLRALLRNKRLKGQAQRDRKLEQKLRKRARTQERERQQKRNRGSSNRTGRGNRRGR